MVQYYSVQKLEAFYVYVVLLTSYAEESDSAVAGNKFQPTQFSFI